MSENKYALMSGLTARGLIFEVYEVKDVKNSERLSYTRANVAQPVIGSFWSF